MLFNYFWGLIVPWLFGIYMARKVPKILLLIFPVGIVISHTINDWGIHERYWIFAPVKENNESVAALPLDLGLYAILAASLIWAIHARKRGSLLIILLFSLGTTLLECFGLLIGRVWYDNGWNVGWTYLSYVFAYYLVYFYYLLLKRQRLL
ncbi:hypothetical protein [Paenibacillus arenilitoris]|uniref:Uncharacterized protein n=1 Tax=Paenibacillus arenilitoris TaxID=2772299 RepID=A0A927H9N3_9BACL|nr:hypothetical protein [Paenibacillus arenilitoris]MBD2871789.1 hypothetical protein [Paenibacillus arenilitoris]